jgi:hypothetical protein
MDKVVINLDGKPTEVTRRHIPLNKITLDVKNPRIQYFIDTNLHDQVTQDKVKFALGEGNEQYERLKDHIERNGGIYNPIWVVSKDDYFLVIEGNTRSFIYEELAEKYVNDDRWKTIDSYILPEWIEKNRINFIRLEAHLFGQTPWDAYEKARELYRLHVEEDYAIKRLEQLTKMNAFEIRNSIQAFKDMEEQYLKKYRSPMERLKFSYFVEFRKNKELKKLVKDGRLGLLDFCDWVGEGKFSRGEEIRKLPSVLKDDEAKQVLVEEDFQSALDQLEQKNPAVKSKLFENIEAVISGLENMPFNELDEIKRGFQPAKIKSLEGLYGTISNFLKNINSIK